MPATLTAPTKNKYSTWVWTAEGYLLLSGVVSEEGFLHYAEPGKPPLVKVDRLTLDDPTASDTLLGKDIVIDHSVRVITPTKNNDQSVGNVIKTWYEPSLKQLLFTALIKNAQFLEILRKNPKTRIGVSPLYHANLERPNNGVPVQRNRVYNNLSLLFHQEPRGGSNVIVFSDSTRRRSKMDSETKTMLQTIVASLAKLVEEETKEDETVNVDGISDYEKGLSDGVAYGQALAYADSLSVPYKPEDTLETILRSVSEKLTGSAQKEGQSAAFYQGVIANAKPNVFGDSTRVNPTDSQNPKDKAQHEARAKMIAKRVNPKGK